MTAAATARGGVLDQCVAHHVTSLAELDNFRRWAGETHDGPLCVDTESAGLSPHRDKHRMTQVGDKRHGWAFPPQWMGGAHEVLARWAGPLGMWNSPYDVRVLGHQSNLWLPWHQIEDGQLACHITDSAPRGMVAAKAGALKPRAAHDIDPTAMTWDRSLEAAKARNGWDWATVPDDFPLYWQYGAMDTCLTSWELDKHLAAVRGRNAQSYDIELAYARIAASMMSSGLMIDRPWIARWTAEITAWYERAMAALAPWGVHSPDASAEIGRALEMAGVVATERTPTGMIKTDRTTMEHYQAEFPHAAELIRTLRDAKKARSILERCLGKFERMADGEIMHYSINTIGAARTGRNSVTDPPMQTFDRDVPLIRGCFRPRPGHVLISWDAAQIEMRMAAHISGDRRLIDELRMCDETGQSFFVNVASRIYGELVPKSDPRYSWTKNTSYATIYGSGLTTAAATAGVSVAQLEPVYRGWKAQFSGLDRWGRELTNKCKDMRSPAARTILGRRLAVDRGKEYSAVDYTIQGSAAEWLKQCVINLDAAGYGPLLRITQHDEVIAEVPVADAPAVLRDVTELLTDRATFRVPLPWEGKIMEERWEK